MNNYIVSKTNYSIELNRIILVGSSPHHEFKKASILYHLCKTNKSELFSDWRIFRICFFFLIIFKQPRQETFAPCLVFVYVDLSGNVYLFFNLNYIFCL